MSSPSILALVGALLFSGVFAGLGPDAATSDRDDGPRWHAVRVRFDPEATALSPDDVLEALEGHLTDLGVRVEVRRDPGRNQPPPQWTAEPPQRGFARVWLERNGSGDLRVRVWTPGVAEAWSREINDDGDTDLTLEALGVVVRGALATAAPTEPTATIDEPEAAAPAAPPQQQLDLGLAYRGESFAAPQRWHNGVRLDLAWEGVRGVLLDFGAAWVPPHRGAAGMTLQRIPLDVAVGWRSRTGRRFRPGVMAVGVVDVLGWTDAAPGLLARPGWALRLGVGGAVDATIDLHPAVFAFARASGQVWVRGAELVAQGPGGQRRLLRPAPVSGSVLVGIGAHLFFIRNRRPAAPAKTSH